jgi:hypothetical protein
MQRSIVRRAFAGLALALACAHANAGARLEATAPSFAFGEKVRLQLQSEGLPIYLPGTRYARYGTSIELNYEYTNDRFGPWRGDFGFPSPTELGELPPGDYRARAELLPLDGDANPAYASVAFTVQPPSQPGIYTVPSIPEAGTPTEIVLVGATPIDADSLKVAVGEGVVRVDFRFSPVMGNLKWVATAKLPVLPVGHYRFEAWGTPQSGGEPALYFSRALDLQPVVTVTEFYHEDLDHYFVTARAEDVALLDAGAYGEWKRTTQRFKAWANAQAASGLRPVCRFYAEAHRGHLFTLDANECEQLKALEKQGKAAAAQQKATYRGYQYEGIAFYAYPPAGGTCPKGLALVNRFSRIDGKTGAVDFRFTALGEQYSAMAATWQDDGAAFCVPA